MSIRAQLPGGEILEFPDGTDDAVIDATVQRHIKGAVGPGSEAATRPPTDPARMSLNEFGTPLASSQFGEGRAPKSRHQGMMDEAMVSGGSNLLGMPGDLPELVVNGPGALTKFLYEKLGATAPAWTQGEPWKNPIPGSEYYKEGARERGLLGNPAYEPKTPTEKLFWRSVEGGAGSPFGPASIILGAAGGFAGEAAAELLGEWARMPFQLATPAGLFAAKRLFRAAPEANVRAAVSRLADDEATKALQLFDDAERAGTPITVGEAVAQATGGNNRLLSMQRVAEQSRGGGPVMETMMNARPAANQRAVAAAMDELGMPPADPASVPFRVTGSAERVISGERTATNAASRPAYAATANNPQAVIPMSSGLPVRGQPAPRGFDVIAADPILTDAIAAVRADKIYSSQLRGLPDNAVPVLDQTKKYLDDAVEAAKRAGEGNKARLLEQSRERLVDVIDENFPRYASARNIQSMRQRLVEEPLEQSQVGSLSRITAESAEQRFGAAAEILFPKRPGVTTPEAVSQAVKQLQFKDPEAAREFTRLFLEREFADAVKRASKSPGYEGATFRDMVMGNPRQAENLEAAIKALPNGDRAWSGFQTLMDVFEAQGKRMKPGSSTEFNAQLGRELSQASPAGAAVENALNLPAAPGKVRGFLEWARYGKNTERLAELLTDRDTLAKLGNLSLMRPDSGKAQLLATEIVAGTGAARREEKP